MFKQFASVCITLIPFLGISQLNNSYTVNGLGEKNHINNATFSGYGDASVAYAKESILNTSNPASYSFLKYQFPIFSIGTGTRFSSINTADGKSTTNYTGLPEIAIGLSFAKRFGIAFGLRPFTQKSYSFSETSAIGTDSIYHKYQGTGSLNQFFGGLAFNILNGDKVKWSVGTNASAVFGQVRDERIAQVTTVANALGGIEWTNKSVAAFLIDFGTIVNTKITKTDELTLGAYFQPQTNLGGKSNTLLMTSTNINEPSTYNSISQLGERKVTYVYGAAWKVGATYSRTFINQNSKSERIRTSLWSTSFNYGNQDFSVNKMYGTDANPTKDEALGFDLKNVQSINVGTEFTPQVLIEGANIIKLFNRSTYRLGFVDKTLPFVVGGHQLKEWYASVGMGIPMVIDRRMDSSLQFSVGMGKRNAGDYQENTFQFNIGIMIAPGFNDRWFIKKKLD